MLLASSCKDPREDWPYKCRVYPCPSSFTGLVGGQSWSGKDFRGCENSQANYFIDGRGLTEDGYLSVQGTDCVDSIGIGFTLKNVFGEGVFNLLDEGSFAHFVNFRFDTISAVGLGYVADSIIAGEVEIDFLVTENYDAVESNYGRVQGTFCATFLRKDTGDTVEIVDAKFDLIL